MARRHWLALIPMTLVAGILGCGEKPGSAPSAATTSPPPKSKAVHDEDHDHLPGAHGGIVVPIGRDSYHAEAVIEQGGTLSLYMLGPDESKVIEVESQELTAYVKPAGATESIEMKLVAKPQEGDSKGRTSRFAGSLPKEAVSKPMEVTIPILRIGSERFRLGFAVEAKGHADESMPAKVTHDEEVALYLTPGGLYTAEDIKANGNQTASQKFAGFRAQHDLKPGVGEKICPVTLTKANPKVSWIIGGKTYEFCCPPCVDEFLQMAKTNPVAIKTPDEYIKR